MIPDAIYYSIMGVLALILIVNLVIDYIKHHDDY